MHSFVAKLCLACQDSQLFLFELSVSVGGIPYLSLQTLTYRNCIDRTMIVIIYSFCPPISEHKPPPFRAICDDVNFHYLLHLTQLSNSLIMGYKIQRSDTNKQTAKNQQQSSDDCPFVLVLRNRFPFLPFMYEIHVNLGPKKYQQFV